MLGGIFEKNRITEKIQTFDEKITQENFWKDKLSAQKVLKEKKFFENSDLVLGNRFHDYLQPYKDGMPLYIYFGNLFLTFLGRIGLGTMVNDLFQGFRGYSKKFFDTIDTSNMY